MAKIKVLFLCVHNSARSQIAEAFLKKYGNDNYEAESAGLEPGNLNPLAIEVMREIGIDISNNITKDVFTIFQEGEHFDFVITVCDVKNSQRCPVFPGVSKKISWDFEDPSSFRGSYEDKLKRTREIREKIKGSVIDFILNETK